jgi:hypothetical protein
MIPASVVVVVSLWIFTEMVHSNTFPFRGDCEIVFRIDENVKIFSKSKEVKKERAFDVDSRMGSSPDNPTEGRISKSIPIQFLKWKSTSHIRTTNQHSKI